ncbi:hypothetical protein POM88_052734 [Heracleum sosnowskyi]|uniref:Uncharacterized protein n=1 Tax=Heracleum sosnowskyi TaxID=360622 RepID=A0AAD8GQS2_9APIA|nr:hypothetical protein POM88_052734 [Heracleum sosnowskyi]
MQKIALFRFNLTLAIWNPKNFTYDNLYDHHEFFLHPKMINWSLRSDRCKWERVTCEQKTVEVIGLDLSCSQLVGLHHISKQVTQWLIRELEGRRYPRRALNDGESATFDEVGLSNKHHHRSRLIHQFKIPYIH